MFEILSYDLKQNSGVTSKAIIIVYRFGNWVYYRLKNRITKKILWAVYKTLDITIVKAFGNAEIPASCSIGKGLRLPHGGNGIILHSFCKIGDNVILFHQVTLGVDPTNMGKTNHGSPTVGNNVLIGAGAKLIGKIKVGDNVKIGANAVVIKNVPSNSTAVGVPARIINLR